MDIISVISKCNNTCSTLHKEKTLVNFNFISKCQFMLKMHFMDCNMVIWQRIILLFLNFVKRFNLKLCSVLL